MVEFRKSQIGDLDQIVRIAEDAKARVLLTLCLMKGMDLAAITEAFETH